MAGILFQGPITNRKEPHSAGSWDLCTNAQLPARVGLDNNDLDRLIRKEKTTYTNCCVEYGEGINKK